MPSQNIFAAYLCAASVRYASLAGMIKCSPEQRSSDNQKTSSITEHSKWPLGANEKTNENTKKTDYKQEWHKTSIEQPTDRLLVLFNGLSGVATIAMFVSGERNVDAARKATEAPPPKRPPPLRQISLLLMLFIETNDRGHFRKN